MSTFDQTWFLKRGVEGDRGWVQISDAITNLSTDPTLLKSIAYLIFIATSNRHSQFIERPVMISVEDFSSDSSEEERNDDEEYKCKGKSSLKGPSVITRSQSRKNLEPLDNNADL